MGLGLAEPGYHTRCYVEIEDYPRQCLIAAQRAGYMAPAPIWDDVKTFDAKPFAGAFDTLIAGYPCQPVSQAGKRLGKDDERWLWNDIARIIRELGDGLRWCFFENVRGHVTLGGETVLRELHQMDFAVSAGIFSAEEVDASHERQRIFIVAYRESVDGRSEQPEGGAGCRRAGFAGSSGETVAYRDSDLAGAIEGQPDARTDGGRHTAWGGGKIVENTGCDDDTRWLDAKRNQGAASRSEGQASQWQRFRGESGGAGNENQLADASQPGLQRREQRRSHEERHGSIASGSTAQFRGSFFFPPGPRDMDAWHEVIANAPYLAPSLSLRNVKSICDCYAALVEAGRMEEAEAESIIRLVAHGLSDRPRALRLLGNGVVPLAAAHAWRSLSASCGLRPLDLVATGKD